MRRKITINNTTKQKTFEEGFNEFIRYCEVRNLRPASIKTYNDVVYHVWYKFYNKDHLIKDIDKSVFENFIIFLKQKMNEKDISIVSNIKKMRTILNYFFKLEYLKQFKIDVIKVDKDVIETYTDEELKILLEKPNLKKCTFVTYRNWCIIKFLLATGAILSKIVV